VTEIEKYPLDNSEENLEILLNVQEEFS